MRWIKTRLPLATCLFYSLCPTKHVCVVADVYSCAWSAKLWRIDCVSRYWGDTCGGSLLSSCGRIPPCKGHVVSQRIAGLLLHEPLSAAALTAETYARGFGSPENPLVSRSGPCQGKVSANACKMGWRALYQVCIGLGRSWGSFAPGLPHEDAKWVLLSHWMAGQS